MLLRSRGRPTAAPACRGAGGRSRTSSVVPISTMRPRYITATRSAMFQASPRSWVTTRIETPVSFDQVSIRARISPRTEASRPDTGSSATISRGLQGHGPGDDHPLALAARHLVGVAQEEALRRAQAALGQRLGHPLLLVAVRPVDADALGHGLVDRLAGVQRAGRVLEHHLHGPAVAPSSGGSRPGWPRPRSGPDRRGLLEADDRAGQGRLAAARLADQRHHLAVGDLEIDAVDGPGVAEARRCRSSSSSRASLIDTPAGGPGGQDARGPAALARAPQLDVGRRAVGPGVGAAGVERAARRAARAGRAGRRRARTAHARSRRVTDRRERRGQRPGVGVDRARRRPLAGPLLDDAPGVHHGQARGRRRSAPTGRG